MTKIDSKQVQRPITLHVDSVDFRPSVDYLAGRRVTVIDLEITEVDAHKIVEELTKRLERDFAVGAIRIRFLGNLVL
jgi:hypothetical protein